MQPGQITSLLTEILTGTTILRYIKNKKQQFQSKKSLNEINLYFDALFSGIRVFSMKFIKRNETNGVLFLAKMVHSLIPLVRK